MTSQTRPVFSEQHYQARAAELEAAANLATDDNIRASYRELAQAFREMAELARVRMTSDAEVEGLAERMVSNGSNKTNGRSFP